MCVRTCEASTAVAVAALSRFARFSVFCRSALDAMSSIQTIDEQHVADFLAHILADPQSALSFVASLPFETRTQFVAAHATLMVRVRQRLGLPPIIFDGEGPPVQGSADDG